MKLKSSIILILSLSAFLTSCESLKESSKYQMVDGYYRVKTNGKTEKLYALTGSDTIKAYRISDIRRQKIDTSHASLFAFPSKMPDNFRGYYFRRNTFDFDVLTVLFKFRFSTKGFPPQLTTGFNGALYFGYRTDVYRLTYKTSPLHFQKRVITHYGYSFGLFTGLGTARIDEYNTENALTYEYDGMVNLTGIAFIMALDKLTAGITLGVDHLLDKNHGAWINNGKPWLGLSLGLNIN